jgi:hypothetical protein
MTADDLAFADRLECCFAALNARIERQFLAQLASGSDVFHSLCFDLDSASLDSLRRALSSDSELWSDFQIAVGAHRKSTHWNTLIEHVVSIGEIEGKLRVLESVSPSPSTGARRRMARYRNDLDGEIALCRHFADRRNLAAQINCSIGWPAIDGLTLRALTYLFGEHPELWAAFHRQVEGFTLAVKDQPSTKDTQR